MTTENFKVGKVSSPRTFHQLGILVLDGSGSMSDTAQMQLTKAQSVNMAVRDLLGRIQVGRAAKNFSFAVVNFDTGASVKLSTTPLENVDTNDDYDPMKSHGGGTHIFEGLNEAKKLAEDFLNSAPSDGVPHSVIVLLMSDGMCFQPQVTQAVSQNIKQNPKIKVACTYFGTIGTSGQEEQQAQDLLKGVSTDPVQFYKTTYGAEDLRAFFEASISKSAGIKL